LNDNATVFRVDTLNASDAPTDVTAPRTRFERFQSCLSTFELGVGYHEPLHRVEIHNLSQTWKNERQKSSFQIGNRFREVGTGVGG
jgi:hypothetical protein